MSVLGGSSKAELVLANLAPYDSYDVIGPTPTLYAYVNGDER